jgi:hypothetical protein
LGDSYELLGAASDYFLFITPLKAIGAGGFKRIADERLGSDEFLLIPYNDGGLISVSSEVLPFQCLSNSQRARLVDELLDEAIGAEIV